MRRQWASVVAPKGIVMCPVVRVAAGSWKARGNVWKARGRRCQSEGWGIRVVRWESSEDWYVRSARWGDLVVVVVRIDVEGIDRKETLYPKKCKWE